MRYGELSMVGLAMLLAACGTRSSGPVAPADIPDPTVSSRTGSPNDWLVCPPNACKAVASEAAPVYPVPPQRLFEAWLRVIAEQPRATVLGRDPDRLLILAEDRTRWLGFVDTVSIKVLPDGAEGSSFAAYSHSNLGSYDFNANRNRLRDWIGKLQAALGQP